MIRIAARGATCKIVEQRVADFLGQGQCHLVPAFTGHSQDAVAPVNVAETKSVEAQPVKAQSATLEKTDRVETKPAAGADENLLAIKAPLLGIFYRRPQPGSPPYVEVGSLVDENTTVALMEVMKLFNPVRAGVMGRIHKICIEDGELVEYNQVLFLLKPE